jgi:hypothetical protein
LCLFVGFLLVPFFDSKKQSTMANKDGLVWLSTTDSSAPSHALKSDTQYIVGGLFKM